MTLRLVACRGVRSLPACGRCPSSVGAALATVLFAIGGLMQLAGAPAAVWWGLYLACYAAGGWRPALDGLRALRSGRWTWTC